MTAETVNNRRLYAFANTGHAESANVGSARATVNAALVLTDGDSDRVICVNTEFMRAQQDGLFNRAARLFNTLNSDEARAAVGLKPFPLPLPEDANAWRQQNPYADDVNMTPVYVRLGWTWQAAPADHFFARFQQKPLTIILRNESPTSTTRALDTGGARLPLIKPALPVDDSMQRDYGEESQLPHMSFGLHGSHIPPEPGDINNHLLSAMPSAPVTMTRDEGTATLRDTFGVTLNPNRKNVVVFVGDPKPMCGFYFPIEQTLAELHELRVAKRRNILLTTSRRTCLSHISEIKEWQSGRHALHFANIYTENPNNPRDALMAVADFCVTSAESLSMVAELRATGKPVAVFGDRYESVSAQLRNGEIDSFCGQYTDFPRVRRNELPAVQFKAAVLKKLESLR